MRTIFVSLASILIGAPWLPVLSAAEPITLDNVIDPGANSPDEPLAGRFSLESATRFLDSAALSWTKNRKCFTCHTNFSYLLARPLVDHQARAHILVREALEQLVERRWSDEGPRWDAEVVMSAAVLACNDATTSGTLNPTTRKALDRMWTLQREDGGFDWLKCDWPPMESDDHYGATIALIGVGTAPDNYAETPQAISGIQKLKSYLQQNPPPTLHHKAMLVWANSKVEGILSHQEQSSIVEELLALQKSDGGWALASMGNWKRGDDQPQDTKTSDGYATGFVIYVLRQSGEQADHPALQKGITWLKQNQRQSGRWFTRSLHKDSKHFISHAGTAFAVMALKACDE